MKRLYVVALILLSFLTMSGCNTNSVPPKPITKEPIKDTQDSFLKDQEYYIGTMNKDIKLRMMLGRTNSTIQGKYSYINQDKELDLEGVMNNNTIEMEEYYPTALDPNVQSTGKFILKPDNPGTQKGTWESPDHKKKYDVILEEISNDTPMQKKYGGHYEMDQATYLDVLFLDENTIKFQGHAQWLGDAPASLHTGDVGNILTFKNGEALYNDEVDGCKIHLTFSGKSITAKELEKGLTGFPCGGFNVTFDGEYLKKGDSIPSWDVYNMRYAGE